jgi:hypothetical protein
LSGGIIMKSFFNLFLQWYRSRRCDVAFNYCVGTPWPDVIPSFQYRNSLCIYSHEKQIQYGTMEDARGFLKFVDERTERKNHIYMLVMVQ